jgi:hypothetical protein
MYPAQGLHIVMYLGTDFREYLLDDVAAQPKYAVIGGSGVTVAGEERFSFKTPLGYLVNISFLDEAKRVVFVNRHTF